jgi:uncharacterized protein (TIGR02996 family)
MPRSPARFPTHGAELTALLAACHREPDDDTPRLVLADWLQERDDPRGELVRLQVRLAAMPAGDPEHDALFDQHQKWWKKYGSLWKKEAGDCLWDPGPHDRGLPTLGSYDREAGWIDSNHLQETPLFRLPAVVAAGWPSLAWVCPAGLIEESEWDEAGDYDDYDDDEHVPARYDPEADDWDDSPPVVDPFETFRQAPWKGSPTPVGVRFPAGMAVTAEHIDQAAKVPNVRGLSLLEALAGPELLPRIARIKSLEHLDLDHMRLGDDGVRALAPLKKLRTLVARGATFGAAGAAVFANNFRELRELRVGTRRLTSTGYKLIAQLPKLEVLELAKADDAAVRHLAPLSRLRRLYLDETDVTGRGVEKFPLLTHLGVSRTPFGDAGMAAVAALLRLRSLNVTGTGITGAGLAHLRGLRWLEELYVVETGLRDRDLVHLDPLKRLRTIAIWDTDVTKKGVAALRKKFKSATIHA